MPAEVAFDPMALYDFGAEDLDPNITYCIEAQEIFEIGTHRGQPYTGEHNDIIAENFKRFFFAKPIPLLVPPAVIGHEEDQEVLKRSDLPAAGWVTSCWVDGTKLVVNIGEIPALVMYWIKTGKIRTVSAEIYNDSGDAGLPPGHGPTLRRVAFLGGDIPQVKTLSRLKVPVPEKAGAAMQFSERVRVYTMPVSQFIRYFAEGKPMKHPKLFDEMKKDGVDEKVAQMMGELDMQPDQLQKMSACMKKYADALAPPTPAPAAAPPAPAAAPFDRAACIEMIASTSGVDRAVLEQKTDDELKALMGPQPAAMSDKAEEPTKLAAGTSTAEDARTLDTTGGGGNTAQADAIKQETMKKPAGDAATFSETNRRLSDLQARLDEQDRRARLASLKAKQERVNKFAEQVIKEGKVTPAEMNGGLKDLLMGADDSRVLKFSDGSTGTALDKQIALIEKRQKLHIFSELLPTSKDEMAKVEAEAERLMGKTDLGKAHLAKNKK